MLAAAKSARAVRIDALRRRSPFRVRPREWGGFMRFAYAAIFSLVIAAILPFGAAASQISEGSDVAAARVAAEQELVSLSISPGDAVFQVGTRNYAGPNCPGNGWSCTTASVVVQINTTTTSSSVNISQCGPSGVVTNDPTTGVCVVLQISTGNAANNAKCFERTSANPAFERCKIRQQNVSGLNKAFVDQGVFQSQATSTASQPQESWQIARVRQFNGTGRNDSTVWQTVIQNEFQSARGSSILTVDQNQEAHQDVDVCQGGTTSACGTGSDGRNKSSIIQTNLQNARVEFDSNTIAAITQKQNIDPNRPTIIAGVTQNTSNKTNESTLVHVNGQLASVYRAGDRDDDDEAATLAVFNGGPITQQQGSGIRCNPPYKGGVCGFVEQTQFSDPVLAGPLEEQTARQWQNEGQVLVAPKRLTTSQTQYGPLFCCATQLPVLADGGNPNNVDLINQNKVQLHTASFAQGEVQGHCLTSGNCTIDQTLVQTGNPTQRNTCPSATQCGDPACDGHICNPQIDCTFAVSEGGCSRQDITGAPIPPRPMCDETCESIFIGPN